MSTFFGNDCRLYARGVDGERYDVHSAAVSLERLGVEERLVGIAHVDTTLLLDKVREN